MICRSLREGDSRVVPRTRRPSEEPAPWIFEHQGVRRTSTRPKAARYLRTANSRYYRSDRRRRCQAMTTTRIAPTITQGSVRSSKSFIIFSLSSGPHGLRRPLALISAEESRQRGIASVRSAGHSNVIRIVGPRCEYSHRHHSHSTERHFHTPSGKLLGMITVRPAFWLKNSLRSTACESSLGMRGLLADGLLLRAAVEGAKTLPDVYLSSARINRADSSREPSARRWRVRLRLGGMPGRS